MSINDYNSGSAVQGVIDKTKPPVQEVLGQVQSGWTILIGGFGSVGVPERLIDEVLEQGSEELTIVTNNAGSSEAGIAKLLKSGRVKKLICSFPRQRGSYVFDDLYRAGKIELELVPQGTLAERIRAAGAGIGAFFTRTSCGTSLAEGKEIRLIDGVEQVLEFALPGDLALVQAHRADRWGNLTYRMTARNFNPIMASAARLTVAQVSSLADLGELDPECIATPGIFVDSVVEYASSQPSVSTDRGME